MFMTNSCDILIGPFNKIIQINDNAVIFSGLLNVR